MQMINFQLKINLKVFSKKVIKRINLTLNIMNAIIIKKRKYTIKGKLEWECLLDQDDNYVMMKITNKFIIQENSNMECMMEKDRTFKYSKMGVTSLVNSIMI